MSVRMDLFAAAGAMDGTLVGENVSFLGASTDSRKTAAGELFFALRGEHFDGHEFVAAAKTRGALAAVVDRAGAGKLREAGLPLIVVADTRLALGALAAAWRSRFTLPVIAVTGSNGKTTSKEMVAAVLSAAFGEAYDAVLATQGNLNNEIGLPLTLLRLDATHRAAVIEMGMNHPGEIAYLAGIARPTVALLTNVQRAHLAGMGSLESIAAEKGSLFAGLAADGVGVFSADEPWGDLWRGQLGARRTMTFSCERAADLTGRCRTRGLENHVTIGARGEEVEVDLALPGAHNARNALGAAAACLAAGVPLAAVGAGLAAFRGIKGRLQRRPGLNGATVLDDTYNANPDSVCAGIDVLASTPGRKILVLGEMAEIGEMAGQLHDEVGGYAKSQGIDRLLTLGETSALAAYNFGEGARHFTKVEDLIAALAGELTPDTVVLVKGSRFMRMERVADAVAAPQAEGSR